MKYFRMKNGIGLDDGVEYIQRESDKALIPCNEANADYQAYLADKDKVVEDFDYEAEKARQKAAENAPKVPTLEERVKALEEKVGREVA